MEGDQVDIDRPAKRRKIEDEALTTLATSDYIVIDRQIYQITIADVDLYKSLTIANNDTRVEIVDSTSHESYQIIRIRASWLKPSAKISTFDDHSCTTAKNLIKSCQGLPSSIKKAKHALDQPLAKYEARLSLSGQQPLLEVRILWLDSTSPRERIDDHYRSVLYAPFSPNPTKSVDYQFCGLPWSVKDFYDNVHVPSPELTERLKLDMLECTLYPFQDRATRWMLSREGVDALSSGQLVASEQNASKLPLDFRQEQDAFRHPIYISNALGVITTSSTELQDRYQPVRGGILAEAMGLGKTVEVIALMSLHRKTNSPLEMRNPDGLRETSATLIITPPSILEQWCQEIAEHAPGLQVYRYTGMKGHKKDKKNMIEFLAQQDVVLTTYNVIASEIHYVKERPDRNLRSRPRRELPKSPLTQILWWRCLLDEAQMVESGVSNAATVARLIPRVNAWAVTGTPLKQSHRDLYGLLLFLRYEPWCLSTRMWDHLVSFQRSLFQEMIGEITLRHSKELVRDELRIPPQSRQVASLPFTAIEESRYSQLHHEMQEECGFDSTGSPVGDDWDLDSPVRVEKMRGWLQRLRQTCLHPEVGGRNRRALGRRGGPLRTVAQVLEVMIEQTDSTVHTEQRNYLMAKTDRARIFEHARQSEVAQKLFNEAYAEVLTIVADARKEMAEETAKFSKKDAETAHERSDMEDEEEEVNASLLTARQRLRSALEIQHICIFFVGNTYFQLKAQQELLLPTPQGATDGTASGIPEANDAASAEVSMQNDHSETANETTVKATPENEAKIRAKIAEYEALESKSYEEAKAIRTELLMDVQMKAQKRIDSIRTKRESNAFVVIPQLDCPVDDFGGIESRRAFEKLHSYCKAMNAQADQFQGIRAKMVDMLDRTLVDKEEGVELTGEEYEDSTKIQDEMYVMMEVLRALFADRSDAISGQENLLLKQETKTFLRAAKEGEGPAPELMIRLFGERETKRIIPAQDGSLRGIITEIRSLATALEWQEASSTRARAELAIVNKLLLHVQQMMTVQSKSVTALEQEVNSFKDAMNARLAYYRALQRISDMVAPIADEELVGKPVDKAWVGRIQTLEETASKKLSVALSKRRYLLHLKQESEADGEAKICTICQFEFENGTLTVCGHQFCKECISMWWSEHRNCPVCKRRLNLTDFHDITYKPAAPRVEEAPAEPSDAKETGDSRTEQSNSIYTTIPSHTLNEIRSIEVRGSSYGSKVDTLIRHILYLRTRDPGSKSVIFSQYRDFLDVLSRSLRENEIVHSKFDDKEGIINFKSNPANECFLLHAKAHATGLNLVCANHVILCEPLINTAIELQAVARVHRIGQQRATTVWMFLIEGTVEQAIHDISVKRRLAHMDDRGRSYHSSSSSSHNASTSASTSASRTASANTRAHVHNHHQRSTNQEDILDAADARELQAADLTKMFAKGNTGGEMVDQHDLWGCLFGHVARGGGRGADVEGDGEREIARFLRAEAAEQRQREEGERIVMR